ncbi:protein AMBP-like [Genypterus blacodes]|uniref:protein AMBP-like n=1 Tax=Genypterus blacodes TaxID=154954 RepID=UPI003F7760F7
MQKEVFLGSLLVLGWVWALQGLPVLPEPLYPTQENFDLAQFMGTWHDVAVATSCPHMQRHRDSAIGKLTLETGDTADKIKMTRTALMHGTCREMEGVYELTDTPGRVFYHIEKWGADVDAYVVHTNYIEYAVLILSKQKSSGDKSVSLKLYSRTMDIRPAVLDDFKALVRQQGMSDTSIIIKKNKGDCVPGVQVEEPTVQPDTQRFRRNVVPSVAPIDEEASGDETNLVLRKPEDCQVAADPGPCFGLFPRFFYNSTSMSCVMFNYGGCLGNQNNFVTERECLQSCRTEAVCRLPMLAKPCKGQPPLWAFDSSVGLCVPYKQGFCQTNGNKFYTKSECEEYCGVVKDDLLAAN